MVGCRGSEGLQSESQYYQEQIARVSQAERHPRGLSCLAIQPLISIQRKAEDAVAASLFALLCGPPAPQDPLTSLSRPAPFNIAAVVLL